mmetsp:Transcript_6234/g.10157  ORF Transcript_6234/g.10157 Transcript_6234/m.10157 type:complete len:82 (+) Transcript_6234:257-502(+)
MPTQEKKRNKFKTLKKRIMKKRQQSQKTIPAKPDKVTTYEMTMNQRHNMMLDYQKKIHLLRRSLGRGHLERVDEDICKFPS